MRMGPAPAGDNAGHAGSVGGNLFRNHETQSAPDLVRGRLSSKCERYVMF